MTATITIPRGSVEYVAATVTADETLDDTVGVAIALTATGSTHTWLTAAWEGTAGLTRRARTASPITFDDATYPGRNYNVYLKLTDSPEAPILAAGRVAIS